MATPKIVAVVDDDPSMLKGIERLLKVYGFCAKTFSSGEDFLSRAAASGAACVVMDIHLGTTSGIEFRRRLAAAGSEMPVIFMTALDDDATRREAMDAGCVAYLRKPFSAKLLLEAIGKAAA